MKAIFSLVFVLLGLACSPIPRSSNFRVIVLGFDGVYPNLIWEWMEHLPNIQKLSQTGGPCRPWVLPILLNLRWPGPVLPPD